MDLRRTTIEGVFSAWAAVGGTPYAEVKFTKSDRTHHCYFNTLEDAEKFINLLPAYVAAALVSGQPLIYDKLLRQVREDNNLFWRPF